jgi:UDP-N-acetylmuramoyl-tripeptide--D-alanyl-D-alanine ligase
MTLDIQEVAAALNATGSPAAGRAAGWSVDTRTQNWGDVYFALRGPNHDGHRYVAAAVEKGAAAVVVEREVGVANQLVVGDTLLALQRLAAWARGRWGGKGGGKVIGVTGSAGKTTTKDAIAHLLAVEMPVGKTVGNLNNQVGVPLSILRLPDDCRAAVLEMGMNHAGEIRALAEIAKPDVGVVTNVGYAHTEFFDSIDGVAAAKRELIEALEPGGVGSGGVAVLNADDARVLQFRAAHAGRTITFGFSEGADVRAERADYRADLQSNVMRFRALGVDFETGLVGRHAVMNLLAAIAVAQVFEIAPERLREPIKTFAVGKMRGERTEHKGTVVWNDCYNSNPEAAQFMIDVLRQTPAGKRIAVLGEMLELGTAAEELHRQVGRYAAGHGVDVLVGVRGHARSMVEAAVKAGLAKTAAHFFDDPAEAGDFVRRTARAGDAVLFKGSRGVKVEQALERFLA